MSHIGPNRQRDNKAGSRLSQCVDRTFNPNTAFVFFDDTVHHRQTQARTFARFFRREKGFNDLIQMLSLDSGTLVCDPYIDLIRLSVTLNDHGVCVLAGIPCVGQ